METFTAKVRRVGNSLSILLPKAFLEELQVKEGDPVEVALFPVRTERQKALRAAIGSLPSLAPFQRDREDRF